MLEMLSSNTLFNTLWSVVPTDLRRYFSRINRSYLFDPEVRKTIEQKKKHHLVKNFLKMKSTVVTSFAVNCDFSNKRMLES